MSSNTNTALLVMDVQAGILARLEHKEQFIKKITAAVYGARARKIPVIFIVVGFRPGFPEVSDDNKMFGVARQNTTQAMINPRPSAQPEENDIVVSKRRVSAFTGSDLEVIRRARHITHLALCGFRRAELFCRPFVKLRIRTTRSRYFLISVMVQMKPFSEH